MNDSTDGAVPPGTDGGGVRWGLATVGFALCVCLLAAALAGGAVAQEADNDTEAPEFGNATKGNLTTIELTIVDDTDVDEDSIARADFALDHGTISEVDVNETGRNATVEIRLASVVAHDNITVSIADNRSITDAAGNPLREASTVVTGMDGYSPQLQDFSVDRVNESAASLRIVSSEPLSELYVGVGGPGADTLTIDNFTQLEPQGSFEYPYAATVTFERDGEFDVLVGTLVDENGVQTRYRIEKQFLVDRTPPEAVIDGPASVDVGETATFDGNASTDALGVAGYNWSVDGVRVGNGSTLEHAFETPGYHDVTLAVRDRRGNVDTRTTPVLVDAATTRANVTVSATNDSVATVSIGANRSTPRVIIDRNGTLVATPNLRFHSLTVDAPTGERADLSVRSRANVSAWYDGAATPIGGVAVEHDRALSTATFRFSVNSSRLAEAGFEPGDVRLYREVDRWQPVYTTVVDESDGRITYEATAAGLSRFVVAADDGTVDTGPTNDSEGDVAANETDPATNDSEAGETPEATGTARILVDNSTLLTPSVDAGDRALVRATLHNRGNATGDFVTGLVVNNSVVTTQVVTVPPGQNRTVTFAATVDSGGTVVVNGTLAGTLSVGTNGSAATAGGGGLPIPNPLALWPGGLFGRVLGAIFWFLVILYGVLKALAIYLGY